MLGLTAVKVVAGPAGLPAVKGDGDTTEDAAEEGCDDDADKEFDDNEEALDRADGLLETADEGAEAEEGRGLGADVTDRDGLVKLIEAELGTASEADETALEAGVAEMLAGFVDSCFVVESEDGAAVVDEDSGKLDATTDCDETEDGAWA